MAPDFQAPADDAPLLVVDDDRLVLLTLTEGLRQAGYRVLETDNGDEAILLARRHRPRLALLDIRMQGLSGFDVAQHLKDYSRIPFLFLSAYADEQTRRQAQDLGALACLGKPIDINSLVAVIEQALRGTPEPDAAPTQQAMESQPVEPGWMAAQNPAESEAWVPMAVGLLMQRHGLDRRRAASRLQRLALHRRVALAQAACELLEALERLAESDALEP